MLSIIDQISFKKSIFFVVFLDFQKSLLMKSKGRMMQEGQVAPCLKN